MSKGEMKLIKEMVIVSFAVVAGISLFACKKAEVLDKPTIKIDVDADISDGNKINEKEVKTQINNGNNGAKEGVNKTDSNTNNSVNKGKNGENIEKDTNNSSNNSNKGSNKTQETYTYQDPNAESIAQNYIEQNKKREEQEKLLYKNRHNISDAEIDAMPIPDYIKANGLTKERTFHNRLKDHDYLWEYMADPANFKVDYSLSDKEFNKKYGYSKTNGNGALQHLPGAPYTFGADGFPIEHPTGGWDETIVNPYNGKTYNYIGSERQWEDAENPAERRYLTQEEALEISKSFAQSFK